MNEFSSSDPDFPCRSREASQQLGIPDSPEIHLAIADLATRLLPQTEGSPLEPWQRRVAALRTASGAVLFGWSLPAAERELRINAYLPVTDEVPEEVMASPRKNWLAETATKLRATGIHIPKSYQSQRSVYGWQYNDQHDSD